MNEVDEVSLLFDSKASSWENKYSHGGPLAHRIGVFASFLADHVKPGASVLDFGCGTGAIAGQLANGGFKMTACDVSTQMIAQGKRLHRDQAISWYLLRPGWERLPFPDETYEAIIASSVFEYLECVDHVLPECRRVLRSGGKLIMSVPNPEHISRRLERAARPFAQLACKTPLVRDLPKIGSYLAYLRVSRSRFSTQEWQQKALRAALRPLDRERGKHSPSGGGPMMYLAFER